MSSTMDPHGETRGVGGGVAREAESFGPPAGAHVLGADQPQHAVRPDPGGDHSGSYGESLPPVEDVSVGQIVGEVIADFSTLMRQEIELAKAEVTSEAKKSGKGAGMLGAAGLAGYFLALFLSLTLMFLLDLALPLVLAALIVALLWGAAAAVLGQRGRKELREVRPKPEQTIETLKEDVQWAKNRTK